MSIWKMSSSANQPVCVGSSRSSSSAPDVEEAEARRGEEVLDRPAGDEVDAERPNVDVDGADGLVAVGEAERAALVRDPRDRGDVLSVTGAVRDRRAAHERRPLVDRRPRRRSTGIDPSARLDVDDLGAAQLLGVGDLTDGRELVLADDDLRPAAALERQRADDPVHALRDRRGHRELGRLGVQQPREGGARGLRALDPVLPLGAVLVPAVEVLLVRARARVGRARPASRS